MWCSRVVVVGRATAVLALLAVGWAVGAAALVSWGRELLAPAVTGDAADERLVDAVAGSTAVAAALLVTTWFAASLAGAVVTATVEAAASRRLAQLPGRAPLAVRRVAALLLGAGLTTVPATLWTPAALAGEDAADRPVATTSLDRPAPGASAVADTVRVRPGDSLWRIAARHLGTDPPDAAVARAWPRWHRANRAEIGPDPGLVVPGQLLHAPTTEEPR